MKKDIKFSLVYRDMWQSSGKYVPTVAQLKEVAPAIIEMGCFDRVETNGGAFEQVNLLFGENPNTAVREWTAPFRAAGIQTHMLERGLNGLRMNPVPADVRELMYKVKKAQGVDISRSFCGLNDHRNLRLSVEYAKNAGMISQVALSITNSPVHTVDYYMGVVDKVVEYGCDEICLKDMAGIGRPAFLAELTTRIKKKYPSMIVQYHGHCGPGFSPVSMLEVARAGADYLDVAVEPLSLQSSSAFFIYVTGVIIINPSPSSIFAPIYKRHFFVASISSDVVFRLIFVGLSAKAAAIIILCAKDFDAIASIFPDSFFGVIVTFILQAP